MQSIRNFSIIAHIDHGKSTLADRMLEITGTIDKRKMKEQVLDSMELERERGITIKMQPVRMEYGEYILNLIDTPGHIDFSYEVSRALKAVEGSILLVDATQGVQAQTLTTLNMARDAGLTILPVVSKIDSPLARTDEVRSEIVSLLGVREEDVLLVSGKTGEGVKELLDVIIERIPAPKAVIANSPLLSLIFDFQYSNHRGVIVFVRVIEGRVKKGDKLKFMAAKSSFQSLEVGIFSPQEEPKSELLAGEIGYIVTGIKEPGVASVGDTVALQAFSGRALEGYEAARPVVWASIYPENQDHFVTLRQALMRLKLSDSSFTFEEEASGILGRGFRCGFLGMLHLEIITERLRREHNLAIVITTPSITYHVTLKNGQTETIYTPSLFPESHLIQSVREPWIRATVMTPPVYISPLLGMLRDHEAEITDTETMQSRTTLVFDMPLREMMRGFFDKLKSVTSGFGSVSYEMLDERPADVERLDILVADEAVPAFAKVVSKKQVEAEAETAVEKLASILPRQMFTLKIQGRALGRIISSRTLSGMKKDVTQHMYGGDITRKMKLREKQKKGKKKMKEKGRVNIPSDVFLKMMREK